MSELSSTKKTLVSFDGSLIGYAHTICASFAFLSALIVGAYLHYEKIVQNGFYGYPDEWFPSVSATIGDRYPERSIFQILIALTSGPRFLLIVLLYIRLYNQNSRYPTVLLISGILRTFTCGGWVYITSTDDHDAHDVFMIGYILLTIPWDLAVVKLSPVRSNLRLYRRITSLSFFGMLVPLVYWFIQHKVHRRAGAYSIYAYFEWLLIVLDIAFDSWSILDLRDLNVSITPTSVEFATKELHLVKPATVVAKGTDESELNYFRLTINTINSYLFWSVVSSLYLCVWYFPLWYMGLSGYEAAIAFLLSPLILALPFIRNFFCHFPFIPRVLCVLFGVGAYKIPDPESRLISVGVGCAFGSIALVNELWAHGNSANPGKDLKAYTVTFILGLLLANIVKYSFYSNNPIWPIMHESIGGWNSLGIFVGLIGAIFTPKVRVVPTVKPKKRGNHSFFLSALGVGGFIFSLQCMLTDAGTIITWTWNGYPINGPTPVPHSLLSFIAMIIGIYLSIESTYFVSSWKFFTLGLTGAIVLYAFNEWTGFVGGFVYTVYLSAISYPVFKNSTQYNPGFVFFIGFIFNLIISLGHVWIVAYAFVPGGPLLRERTDIILFTSVAMIGCGILNHKLSDNTSLASQASSAVKFVHTLKRRTLTFASVFLVVAITITFKRYPTTAFEPYNPNSQSFTTGIWCIHFGLDNDMWASETRMRDLIFDAQVDIIGLLESDTQRMIGGNRDITQRIAEELGMYVDYGPGPNKHTWGCALLSKFPIINSTHHLLPSPVGELAPAIHATLDIYGSLVDVVVFHSGQEEDEEDRRLQSLELQKITGESSRPLVMLSYLVTKPLEGNYNTYVSEKSRLFDIDSTDWDRWCEYILFRELKKVGYARISRSTITDTELQIAKFKLLTDEELDQLSQQNDELKEKFYGNNFIQEEDVDETLRFPSLFYGDGVRGHRYHVFDEPRYFEH